MEKRRLRWARHAVLPTIEAGWALNRTRRKKLNSTGKKKKNVRGIGGPTTRASGNHGDRASNPDAVLMSNRETGPMMKVRIWTRESADRPRV